MYNYNDFDKKERRKIITVATSIAAIILILIVAIIVVATGKSASKNLGGEDNASFVIEEETTETAPQQEEPKEETKVDTPILSITPTEINVEITDRPIVEAIPETGPTDMLPIAILFGSLASISTALIMQKDHNKL